MFLSVSKIGLCSSCQQLVLMEARDRVRIINDSIEIIKKTQNINVTLSRFDLLLEHFKALIEYEKKGINFLSYSPTEALRKLTGDRDNTILEWLEKEHQNVITKSKLATTPSGKLSPFSKFILVIREFKTKTTDPHKLDSIEFTVLDEYHKTTLDIHLDNARKAELKGQKKKAIDCYYEAWYFLTHDSIDDSLQQATINMISKKITDLGGLSPDKILPASN